jgi:hypothetical protein
MTHASSLQIKKEIRALLPAWLASAAIIILTWLSGGAFFFLPAILAYCLGALALGAFSIGHEYTGRTLGFLLTQAIDRRRLFALKLGVLAIMLVTLGVVAWEGMSVGLGLDAQRIPRVWILFLPALCGLCVAPLLTMISRSPLGGVVFTIVVMASMWGLGEVSSVIRYGAESAGSAEPKIFRMAVVSWGITIVSFLAAIASWRSFVRLEAIEDRDADVQLPAWLRVQARDKGDPRASARPGVVLQLVSTELYLPQMTFVVAGIYLLGWAASALLELYTKDVDSMHLGALTILYGQMLGLLAGSLASAEERQLGTLQWQVLLPLATWKQWATKAGVALTLAMLLGFALPSLLASIGLLGGEMPSMAGLAVTVAAFGFVGLYVSSFSTSGVRALLASIPVVLGSVIAIRTVTGVALAQVARLLSGVHARSPQRQFLLVALHSWTPRIIVAFVGTAIVMLLWFGLVNHRSMERRTRRIVIQGVCLFSTLAIAGFFLAMVT